MAGFTPGPWTLCAHLESKETDDACSCGYRGVIWGPEHDVAYAVCQPGHDPAPKGQEGTEPARYPRDVELANANLIAAAPELYAGLDLATTNLELLARYHASDGEQTDLLRSTTANLRRILAKARGEA